MTLKQKTLRGLSWSFLESFSNQAFTFVVSISLARLIEPAEFGVLGMITIFVALSTSFVDSGFSSALIRKKDCTQFDYSTVFFFNIMAGILLYAILFLAAPYISTFFNEPRLTAILRVSGITLMIGSVGSVPITLFAKDINFKARAKLSIASTILSGTIAVVLAYKGFGVWSLVWRSVLNTTFATLFVWLLSSWRPMLAFSVKSFRELFGFGSKILLSGLIDTAYNNIYYPIIGKIYSPTNLGFYTRAESFQSLFTTSLTSNVQRVTYPILSTIQDNSAYLKITYQKLIKSTMMISFSMILMLAAIAKPLIAILIGEKWLPCVPYLQLMCFSGMLYPLHAMNLNILTVKGRSDLFLRLEIIKKTILIPVILIGIYWGIEALLIGKIVASWVAFFINTYYTADLVGYSGKEQLKDILPQLMVASSVAILVWGITFFQMNDWYTLSIQVVTGAILTVGIYEYLKHTYYKEIKEIVLKVLNKAIVRK